MIVRDPGFDPAEFWSKVREKGTSPAASRRVMGLHDGSAHGLYGVQHDADILYPFIRVYFLHPE